MARCLPPLQPIHGKPLHRQPKDAPKRLVIMQIEMEHLEELQEEGNDKTSEDLSGQSQLAEVTSIDTITA